MFEEWSKRGPICFDVHGDEGLPYNFFAFPWDPLPIRTTDKGFQQTQCNNEPNISKFQTQYGYPRPKPGKGHPGVCSCWVAEHFNCTRKHLNNSLKTMQSFPIWRLLGLQKPQCLVLPVFKHCIYLWKNPILQTFNYRGLKWNDGPTWKSLIGGAVLQFVEINKTLLLLYTRRKRLGGEWPQVFHLLWTHSTEAEVLANKVREADGLFDIKVYPEEIWFPP